jgi:tripartite-type tricarboxylate transporter receptor subunit TctC
MPKDFEQSGVDLSVEVRAEALRKAAAEDANARPSKITEEDKKKMEEEQANVKSKQKKFTHVARSRHQLGTLIQDAQSNRQELEDRIAQMKNNKRGGGAKYGF